LITGASEGLGKELAHELSKQYNFKTLKIVSRSQEKLQAVADEIGECCEV
jgi:short-subunit dehydrogenase